MPLVDIYLCCPLTVSTGTYFRDGWGLCDTSISPSCKSNGQLCGSCCPPPIPLPPFGGINLGVFLGLGNRGFPPNVEIFSSFGTLSVPGRIRTRMQQGFVCFAVILVNDLQGKGEIAVFLFGQYSFSCGFCHFHPLLPFLLVCPSFTPGVDFAGNIDVVLFGNLPLCW